MRKFAASAVAVVALCAFAGCGGSGNRHAAPPQRAVSPPKVKAKAPERHPIQTCRAGGEERIGTSRLAYAAIVRHRALAYRAPGRRPFASFGRLNVNGAVNVLGVVGQVLRRDCSAGWYRVELPIRPNGSWGYVKARAVELSAIHTRIVVDLSARRLTFYRNGRPVLHAVAAVGAPATPTPTGRFYVNQRLIPSSPSGPWGPGAIGISAHSTVLQDSWTEGAPIAIHGTDEPSSIGHAASHGCIRLDNAVLQRLFARTPAGTSVIIHA